jgi:hypothetical protein
MLLVGAVSDMTPEETKTHYALWAMAKAPLILSGDLTKIGVVNDTNSLAHMLNNTHLLDINQDKLGHQCEEIENLNGTGTNDTLKYYKSLTKNKDTEELSFSLLIVNWSDDNLPVNTKINLATAGIALSQFDNCEMTNLWNDKKSSGEGGEVEFETANLAKHDHVLYKIICNPF